MFFTYLLRWTKQNKNYYGVRYKDNVSTESLGTTYFSSSKYVKAFIAQNSAPDIICIRRTFDNKIQAKSWEEKVIRRIGAVNKDNWLNCGNNNSFKNTIMSEDIKKSISISRKGQSFGILYNNGYINKFFKPGYCPPAEWIKGRLNSEKQKDHMFRLNTIILTTELRKHTEETKLKMRKPKKEGHGAKISTALKGKARPWSRGDGNVSKRQDVRDKIKESWKTRITGVWYTDEIINYYIKPNQSIPAGCRRGKVKIEKK